MPRTTSSCGPVVPNYLRHTASSMAQRHPRAAKSFDADSQVTYRSGQWSEKSTPVKTKKRSMSISERPSCQRMKSQSRNTRWVDQDPQNKKQTKTQRRGKNKNAADASLRPEASLRKELEHRLPLKCTSPKACVHASVTSVRSFVDSAKDFNSKSKITQAKSVMRASPESPIKESPAPHREPAERQTAAVVLTLLFRMNAPRPVVHDIFDIVVALNTKAQKRKASQTSHHSCRLSRLCPQLHRLLERLGDFNSGSLLKILQRQTFLVALPLLLLQLVLQFPSLLTTILMMTRGHWQQAFIPSDVYLANGLMGCLLPFHALLRSF